VIVEVFAAGFDALGICPKANGELNRVNVTMINMMYLFSIIKSNQIGYIIYNKLITGNV
jgi:hypothetical protein